MKKTFYSLMITILLIVMSGCSKKSNPVNAPPPPQEAQPSFSITAQPVTLVTGDAGLSFIARCTTDDVNLIKVVVENPRGASVTYNANNNLFVKDQEFQCQDNGQGYVKYLGTWILTFVGNKASGSKSSFNVSVSFSVTGKVKAE